MAEPLVKQYCVACRAGEPQITDEELKQLHPQIPDWDVIEVNGERRLQREFKVKNFAAALDLANRVGALAEQEGHHPALLTEWGRLTVTWWTHKIRGLHQNDVIMAAKTDQVVAETEPPAQ